jgi:hypothetical protein
MSYPSVPSGKGYFPLFLLLLVAWEAGATPAPGATAFRHNYLPARTQNSLINTLYKRDTARFAASGIVRREKSGNIIITTPADAMGRYRIRFLDDQATLLFEVREIRDPVLIIEKYNFGHAGLFEYQLYKDNGLIEKGSFRITP